MPRTKTTLDAGSGGDNMDESLVVQPDGTEAKRPIAVLGLANGQIVGDARDEVPLPVGVRKLENLALRQLLVLERIERLLMKGR